MLIDARTLSGGTRVEADVCVVGAGAAGITLARDLLRSEGSVVLLESGGFRFDNEIQSLYAGEASGPLLEPENDYLTATRQRYFGGTTNHWNGWCRPLDAEDFAEREWVERSGWPVEAADLAPFYERAAAVIGMPAWAEPEADPSRPHLFAPGGAFETTFFQVRAARFGEQYRGLLGRSARARVITFANLTEIELNEAASRVEGLEVATLDGRTFGVRARAYVLAAGGVENARLLLASRRTVEHGLGNDRDLVGRCFMEHPRFRVGYLLSTDPVALKRTYSSFSVGRGRLLRGLLRPSWEMQQRHRLLNSLVMLWKIPASSVPTLGREVAALSNEIAALGGADGAPAEPQCAIAGVATEQSPSLASRVRLDDERDALGMPRAHLEWQLSDADVDSVRRTADLLAAELGASLRGRLHLVRTEEQPWEDAAGSSHHMGTTRMHPSAEQGVVDPDGRVHGIGNLYVAGSSVFPTVGSSNPTLTIVAMALRLGRHLRHELAAQTV